MKLTESRIRQIIREELEDYNNWTFEPTASEEAQKINDQTGIRLVTDQSHWESMGISTGIQLAKYLLMETYSDHYKEIHGIRPRWIWESWKDFTPQEVQAKLDELHLYEEDEAEDDHYKDATNPVEDYYQDFEDDYDIITPPSKKSFNKI